MRYTTIIDITERADLYRSVSARLLYLHLVCIAGYHTDDRDQVHTSLRKLSADTGLTVAAVRHALRQLHKAGLVEHREDGGLDVRKFVQPIIAAARSASTQVDTPAAEAARNAEIARLTAELDRLRRWYVDAEQRGDTESMAEIKAAATETKRKLKKIQP